MHLTIHDRLVLGGILKQEADFLTIAIQKDIKAKIAIDQVTGTAIDMKAEGGSIRWDEEKAKGYEKDIEFTPAEIGHIKACAELVNAQAKVTEENYDLIKKIKEA
jgi:hypothetical protein